MMKRTGAPRMGPDEPPHQQHQPQLQQAGVSNMHTLAQSAQPQILTMSSASILPLSRPFGSAQSPRPGPPGINYLKTAAVGAPAAGSPVGTAPPYQHPSKHAPRIKVPTLVHHQPSLQPLQPAPAPPPASPHNPHNLHTTHNPHNPQNPHPTHQPLQQHGPIGLGLPIGRQSPLPQPPGPQASFQRLKVEDALSYLDQVKYRFNTQPQVYNDFLDIMKEFKSQTIDTPGVITRVSNLFKGHPELIVGFNTFLPPGYKIEVQSNGQVSVSMPSPTGPGGGVLLGVHHAPPQPPLVHLLPVAPPSVSSAIVHNLSVSAPPSNTLHHISQAHQQIEAAAIHHQPGAPANAHTQPQGQPVEFNHAIEYVNKIKSRFSRQPDKYKRFLEILHAYQRGHRDVREPQAKQQTEQEVYSQVAKLFENQEDLLAEFGQFLPDAKAGTKAAGSSGPPSGLTTGYSLPPPLPRPLPLAEAEAERALAAMGSSGVSGVSGVSGAGVSGVSEQPPPRTPPRPELAVHALAHACPPPPKPVPLPLPAAPPHLKRSPSFCAPPHISGAPPPKKSRVSTLSGAAVRDVSYAEAAKLATPHDFAFFDRARRALRSHHVYDNFLRCLVLFTNEIISTSELLQVTAPFLCRHPELQRWLRDLLGPAAAATAPHCLGAASPAHTPNAIAPHGFNKFGSTSNSLLSFDRDRDRSEGSDGKLRYEPLGAYGATLRNERPQGDIALDIDLSTCKRLGTSYCALPKEAAARRCSGRTALCKEVLNDTWVSFPTWSEDSTFVTSRKTQYEEYIYRCEDERFELDVVIETNAATIRVLEGVQKKLSRMSGEEASRFRLDECLGGHSPTIHQRALRRIYGDKVAVDIIAGLKKNPMVAVPVVLRRLKAKEEEWREAQKGFNKQWREQNEKYYLKSLDHQGINFKQNDLKAMRSKSLFNEVESAYAARRPGPHLVVDYGMQNRQEAIRIVRDAADLLIHHARRQTAIQKAEKRRIKQLLRHFLPDLFAHPRQPLSDDERDDEDKEGPNSPESPTEEKPKESDKAAKDGVKAEKTESSESDAASDKSSRNNKDKENKPKNNHLEGRDKEAGNVKRSSSNEDSAIEKKTDVKLEEIEDDYRDHPSNEARFVCTSSWYLFLRVHGVVCQRLGAARREAARLGTGDGDGDGHGDGRDAATAACALRLKPNNLPMDTTNPAEYYNTLLELVKGVLDGNMEPSAYEDAAREMFGIKAYPAYTLDKLVSIAVRQLQHCVSEPWSVRAAELAARGGMRAGGASYVRRAAHYLRQDHTAFLVRVYGGDECKVTFELLEGAGEGRTSPHNNEARLSPTNQSRTTTTNGEAVQRLAEWSLYTERYVRPDVVSARCNKPVFLRRNARRSGGGGGCNVAPGSAPAAVGHARRKPLPINDNSECTLNATLRLVASRAHVMYRAGCLAAARTNNPRLRAARTARFHAWLRTRTRR